MLLHHMTVGSPQAVVLAAGALPGFQQPPALHGGERRAQRCATVAVGEASWSGQLPARGTPANWAWTELLMPTGHD